jgi:hypothetical protein
MPYWISMRLNYMNSMQRLVDQISSSEYAEITFK